MAAAAGAITSPFHPAESALFSQLSRKPCRQLPTAQILTPGAGKYGFTQGIFLPPGTPRKTRMAIQLMLVGTGVSSWLVWGKQRLPFLCTSPRFPCPSGLLLDCPCRRSWPPWVCGVLAHYGLFVCTVWLPVRPHWLVCARVPSAGAEPAWAGGPQASGARALYPRGHHSSKQCPPTLAPWGGLPSPVTWVKAERRTGPRRLLGQAAGGKSGRLYQSPFLVLFVQNTMI